MKEITISKDRLCDQRYVIFGAGSAGMGIATQLRTAMIAEDGISKEEATKLFWLVDKHGLLIDRNGMSDSLDDAQREFARPGDELWEQGEIPLLRVVRQARPTVLIGCSTVPGAFDQTLVKAMLDAQNSNERPVFLPLSNPTNLVEGKPYDILRWANGRALVATGSPFPKVEVNIFGQSRFDE
jgi:malate dehydrogenase (oxaloacetate-decarboxylating)